MAGRETSRRGFISATIGRSYRKFHRNPLAVDTAPDSVITGCHTWLPILRSHHYQRPITTFLWENVADIRQIYARAVGLTNPNGLIGNLLIVLHCWSLHFWYSSYEMFFFFLRLKWHFTNVLCKIEYFRFLRF